MTRNYIKILKSNGIKILMSGRLNPCSNNKMGSLFSILKVEEIYMNEFQTFEDVFNSIPYCTSELYNKIRLNFSMRTVCLWKSLNIYLRIARLISWFLLKLRLPPTFGVRIKEVV